MWRASELRGLDGTRLRETAAPGGALEKLVGKGKAGKTWDEVMRRVAQVRGDRLDAMGRVVRAVPSWVQVQQTTGCLGEGSSE